MEVNGKKIQEWIGVLPGVPVPLLSYRACRELALIPDQFPQPIVQVTPAAVRSGKDSQTKTPARTNGGPKEKVNSDVTTPPVTPPQLPFTSDTTLEQARTYFLKEYSDVLVKKEDQQTAYARIPHAYPRVRRRTAVCRPHSSADSPGLPRSSQEGAYQHGSSGNHLTRR